MKWYQAFKRWLHNYTETVSTKRLEEEGYDMWTDEDVKASFKAGFKAGVIHKDKTLLEELKNFKATTPLSYYLSAVKKENNG